MAGTLLLVQALGDAGVAAPLWAVTRGAVSVGADGDRVLSPVQAQVWGLGRVAALEHADLWVVWSICRRCWARAWCGAWWVCWRPVPVRVVWSRTRWRFGVRGVRTAFGACGARRAGAVRDWRPSGTVLVTGGTGALGGHVARWLAGHGAEHLLLVSRRGPQAPGADVLAAELTALGAKVTIAACDIADRDALSALLGGIPTEHPLTAVVHTAGSGGSALIADCSPAELVATASAKIAGAVNLDALLHESALEAFVVFSSNAGTWGSRGRAGYAAATAYLDALTQCRRDRGLAATSVAWGVWGGAGAAGDPEISEVAQRHGVPVMDPDTALVALRQTLDRDETCTAVADVDWPRFTVAFTANRGSAFLGELPEVKKALAAQQAEPVAKAGEAGEAGPAATPLVQRLLTMGPADQKHHLLELVRSHVAVVLRHESAHAIDERRAFRDLGFDSVTAVELRNRLNAETGLRLSPTTAFDYPTAEVLAEHLRRELVGEQNAAGLPAVRAAVLDDEPIAIVGMSCRYPGGVRSPEGLWQLVADHVDAVSGLPADRGWDIESLYDEDPDAVGKLYSVEGGFLYDAGEFDPAFFGSPPARPARWTRSSACCWRPRGRSSSGRHRPAQPAREPDRRLRRDQRPGLHDGPGEGLGGVRELRADRRLRQRAVRPDRLHLRAGGAVRVDRHGVLLVPGGAPHGVPGAAVGRVRARGGRRCHGDGDPALFVAFSRQQGLARDGRSKAFAAAADGAGMSEGAGVLLLERLSDAQRNGRTILAVVRGSAVNQDGASNGLTAPNGPSQQRVIRQALANAGLSTSEVDVVEAHGTGTRLGDPIEAQALLATYGQDRDAEQPLWLGSLKSNLGHTQAAAGVAGVIKMSWRCGTARCRSRCTSTRPRRTWTGRRGTSRC
ncbi:SDR family NAD(P)-dependent oxidoreductase [Kitasatospora acidiphila]|uniref:SDR family NAD(P)-dependent oxidoreductase n=1 Tax=Kitasatospora acidiphila TaxID=2567942 RepID=A0A540WGE2_9ACTN|nr:SDR family NAD(P)-dependent oxidoreductase [Kitasatospora acidiphila]